MEGNYVVGICQKMCPPKEAKLRQRENLLHFFEMKKGTESNRLPEYDPDRIVKCFRRSAAGVKKTNPSNLRPFWVLLKTIEYLYLEIFPMHYEKPLTVYNFMFDRFRAVRQDAVIQNLPPEETIILLEPIVRFLIYFGYYLSNEDVSEFDGHINNTHLQECTKQLLVCYNKSRGAHPNRWEIESAYLLFNLGNLKVLTKGFNQSQTKSSKIFLYSLQLSLQWYLKNYHQVIKMIVNLPPLLCCAVSSSLPQLRKHILQSLCYSYSSPNSSYPISRLKYMMLLDNDSDVIRECQCFNIKVSESGIHFWKKDFNLSLDSKSNVRLKWVDKELFECDLVGLLLYGNSQKAYG